MKRLFTLCVSVMIVSCSVVNAYQFANQQLMGSKPGMTRFLGTVVYTQNITTVSEMKILYKGEEYSVEAANDLNGVPSRGHFQLFEKSKCDTLYVLVSESLKRPYDTGFEYFETSARHPYKLFQLTRTTMTQQPENGEAYKLASWHVEELDNSQQRDIPVNTIVLLLPASFVTGLEVEPWQEDGQVAWLPKVVFDDTLTQPQLSEGVVKMLCTLIDFKPFHARAQQQITQVASNCIVSMPIMRSITTG